MTWPTVLDAETPLEGLLCRNPELLARYRDFAARPWSERQVSPVLLELCRLRMAALLRCEPELRIRYRPALDAGLTEEKTAALADWRASELFSEVERACLSLCETYTLDPRGVTDEQVERVLAYLGPEEVVALVSGLAIFDGLARMRVILGVEPASDHLVVVDAPTPERGPIR
jgi:alkylhydroperoxidase family enzyme